MLNSNKDELNTTRHLDACKRENVALTSAYPWTVAWEHKTWRLVPRAAKSRVGRPLCGGRPCPRFASSPDFRPQG